MGGRVDISARQIPGLIVFGGNSSLVSTVPGPRVTQAGSTFARCCFRSLRSTSIPTTSRCTTGRHCMWRLYIWTHSGRHVTVEYAGIRRWQRQHGERYAMGGYLWQRPALGRMGRRQTGRRDPAACPWRGCQCEGLPHAPADASAHGRTSRACTCGRAVGERTRDRCQRRPAVSPLDAVAYGHHGGRRPYCRVATQCAWNQRQRARSQPANASALGRKRAVSSRCPVAAEHPRDRRRRQRPSWAYILGPSVRAGLSRLRDADQAESTSWALRPKTNALVPEMVLSPL